MRSAPTNNEKRATTEEFSSLMMVSPRSTVVEPPAKRQRQTKSGLPNARSAVVRILDFSLGGLEQAAIPEPQCYENSKPCILNHITDEAITAYIFAFGGPSDTARCAQVCRAWHTTSKAHPELWRTFVQKDFQFPRMQYNINDSFIIKDTAIGAAADYKKNTPKDFASNVDWNAVYAYMATQEMRVEPSRLQGKVLFADDGGNFAGRYPAANALRPEKHLVWCTNTGVDKNIDLVIELEAPSLIDNFVIANGGRGFSAPLKEALIFVSMDPPDLEAAKIYNDSNGSLWVQKRLTSQLENNSDEQRSTPTTENVAQGDPYEPIAAVEFPALSSAYTGHSKVTLTRPRVGRYVHFKLLSSYSPPGMEQISDNIDVMHLHTHGVPLDQLNSLVPYESQPVPKYQRQYAVRPSRLNPVDGWFGLFL